jgi:hypothetical protein
LTMRTNFLCQSCHSNVFHPSAAYSGKGISKPDKHLVGRGCVNCHSQIHGSNHPSGALLMR